MTGGQSYYVEALMKEGSGGDNLAVGWRKPSDGSGSSPASVIPGNVLSPASGGGTTTVLPTSVSISGCPGSNMSIGGTANLNETVSPSNATNKNVTWSSSNTSVATVSNTGLVTAVAAGTATITVTTNSGNRTSTCGVTVSAPSGGNTVTVRARLISGSSDQLQFRVNDATVETWTVSSSSFANYTASLSVNGNVKVYFPDNGADMEIDYIIVNGTTYQAESQATNTAVWQNGSCGGSFSSIMHCSGYIDFGTIGSGGGSVAVTGVVVSNCSSPSLSVGGTVDLNHTLSPSNASNQSVSWSSSNNSVATVNSSTGLVTAVAAGAATITVTSASGGFSSGCGVTVTGGGGSSTSYRYLRLTGSGTVGNAVTIQQIQWKVNSATYPNPELVWNTRTNVTTSHTDGNAWNAYNSNNSGWSVGTTFPRSITIDLGAGNAINPNQIRIRPNASDRGFSAFECHGSNNNSSWTLIHSESGLSSSDYSAASNWGTFNLNGAARNANGSDLAKLSEVKLYPNPMTISQDLTIDASELSQFNMQIISLEGRVIFEKQFSSVESSVKLTIGELNQSGIYMIRFNDGDNQWVQKLIVR